MEKESEVEGSGSNKKKNQQKRFCCILFENKEIDHIESLLQQKQNNQVILNNKT